LIAELARVFPHTHNTAIAPAWVASEMQPDEPRGSSDSNHGVEPCTIESASNAPCVALAAQALPAACKIVAASISDWGRVAGQWLLEALQEHDGPWRLHVFSQHFRGAPVGRRRCQLIADQLHELLRKKQRRLVRTERPAGGPWADEEAFVQIALVGADHGFCSVCLPPMRQRLRRIVTPFPGGVVEIAADGEAPSRAFAKLLEAELRMDRRISAGESCVDLGSSPGSWAYVALNRGAKVVAVDRSPLRTDLMANPALEYHRGDAFQYQPPAPVDWLLCDVIAAPARSIELLEQWLERGWCRRFCVTIKFRGDSDDSELEPLKARLAATCGNFLLRRLSNNKNEVTAAGTVD
jgi:23S rRNA (cytidine2498-2'-O)-methyltransferase